MVSLEMRHIWCLMMSAVLGLFDTCGIMSTQYTHIFRFSFVNIWIVLFCNSDQDQIWASLNNNIKITSGYLLYPKLS
jgi:hypothetical protein